MHDTQRMKPNPYRFVARLLCLLFISLAGMTGCGEKILELSPNTQHRTMPNIVVVFTDDQGFADVGYHNMISDIQTPEIDSLAQQGVRMTNGYITAPQCTPSRAALMTGIYQERYGVEENNDGPLPTDIPTVAEYLKDAGYRTGIVGKWALEVTAGSEDWLSTHLTAAAAADPKLESEFERPYHAFFRGFDESFEGYLNYFWATFNPNDGRTFPLRLVEFREDRISLIYRAAVSFIERNSQAPFFLYVAPYAPHLPLAASDEELSRFPEDMPERRRYALAMMAAIDDGVGEIINALKDANVYDNTVVIFMSDNGAPLQLNMPDLPISDETGTWNGSMNTPLTGEKGMLTEGGIHVPFFIHWPASIPGGSVVREPVSSLDAIYTALRIAGVNDSILATLDGTDLMPAILGDGSYLQDRPLFWRFTGESAVRLGDWKLLRTSPIDSYLFDLSMPELADNNVAALHPEIASYLENLLDNWESALPEPGDVNGAETGNYTYHLNPE